MILTNDPRTTYEYFGLFTARIGPTQHLADQFNERV